MKGLLFTELIELIEADHGLAVVDRVIRTAVPPTDGAYTSMANYDPNEFFGLVNSFVAEMQQPRATFLRYFGRHLFRCLIERNEGLLDNYSSAIKAIQNVNELVRATRIFSFDKQPLAEFSEVGPSAWQLTIRSTLPVQDIILGALEACIARYGEPIMVSRTDVETDHEVTTRFDITPKATSCLTTFK